MKQIIEDIRKLLTDGSFKDEQHVRFSLVGRICQKLGWDIWNPNEFYTEYPVKRYPPLEVTTELRGRIDLALILPEKHSDIAEVFIEIKTPYKLQNELVAGEVQLKKYNWWDKSAISVLTDGIIWRFYLPSIGGAFENSLFSEVDILSDDIESICTVFDQVLKRDNFRKQAVESAENIYEEISRIKKLSLVKAEAEDIAKKTGMSKYNIALQLLKNQHNYEIGIAEIERIWMKKLPRVTQAPSTNNNTDFKESTGTKKQQYSTQKPYGSQGTHTLVEVFILKRGITASGIYSPETKQFTLKKGSEIVKDHMSSFIRSDLDNKNNLIREGILLLDRTNAKYILMEDLDFKSSSAASRLVTGRSSDGLNDWVDAKGIKLGEYRNRIKKD